MHSRKSVTGIEPRLSHDDYYLIMARIAALRGTCARRTVGCILVDADYRVLSTGYNGVPSGEPHCIDNPCEGANDPSGDTTRCRAIHAEINAVKPLLDNPGCQRVVRAYISVAPCSACAEYLWSKCKRLHEVHVIRSYPDTRGVEFLHKMGVVVTTHEYILSVNLNVMMQIGERWR